MAEDDYEILPTIDWDQPRRHAWFRHWMVQPEWPWGIAEFHMGCHLNIQSREISLPGEKVFSPVPIPSDGSPWRILKAERDGK